MSQRGVLNKVDVDLGDDTPPEGEDRPSVSPEPMGKYQHPSDRTLPYELPQLPIELIEKKLQVQRQLSRIDRIEENNEVGKDKFQA